MTTDSTYHPVYLFLDPELFEAFLRQIPHSTLIEPFKKDEPLRNRTLRGHRFGAGHPDRHRLAKAYRNEIVERANYGLADYLLKNWVEDRPELISKALARIGVESEVDLDEMQWLGEAHVALNESGHEAGITEIVQGLASSHDSLDVHVVVSMLSYEYGDQASLQRLVDSEFRSFGEDPDLARRMYEESIASLEAEHATITKAIAVSDDTFGQGKSKQATKIEEISAELDQLAAQRTSAEEDLASKNARREELQRKIDITTTDLQTLRQTINSRTKKRQRLKEHVASDHKGHEEQRAGRSDRLHEVELELSRAREDLESLESAAAAKETVDLQCPAPTEGHPIQDRGVQSTEDSLQRFIKICSEERFVPSVVTLDLAHALAQASDLIPFEQVDEPERIEADTVDDWIRYHAFNATQGDSRWSRRHLAEYAYWRSLAEDPDTEENRLELLLSAIFHGAQTRDNKLLGRLVVRLLEAWVGTEATFVTDDTLPQHLVDALESLLRQPPRQREFGLLQVKLAFADQSTLVRLYDLSPISLRIHAKRALAAWLTDELPINERDATHEIVEEVSHAIASQTGPLLAFVRQWWGVATVETIVRGRQKLLSAAARWGRFFDGSAAQTLEALRQYFGAPLSHLAEDHSITQYQHLLRSISEALAATVSTTHFYSRSAFPLLLILHTALARGATEARKAYRSELHLTAEKAQVPIGAAPRQIPVSLQLTNQGNTEAKQLAVIVFVAPEHEAEVSLGQSEFNIDVVPSGRANTVALSLLLDVMEPCQAIQLEYFLTWHDAASADRSSEGTIKLVAQRMVDWDAARVNPYTLRSISLLDRLHGRDKELNRLRGGALGLGSYFLTGQRRVGKTSMARVLCEIMREDEGFCAIYLPLGELSTRNAAAFVRRLFEELIHAHSDMESEVHAALPSETDFEKDPVPAGARVMRQIDESSPAAKFLIALDDFDELPEPMYQGAEADTLFLLLRSLIDRGNLAFLFVGSERLPEIMRFQGERMNQVQRVPLDYLADARATEDLVTRPSKGTLEFSAEALDLIGRLSAGNPFYATKIAARIHADMVAQRDHYVGVADVKRSVEAVVAEDNVTSYQHFWKEGVFLSGHDLEGMQQANAFLLIALSELSKSGAVGRKELLEHKILTPVDSQVLDHRLNNLIERKVVREHSDQLSVRVPLFNQWLQGSGATEVRANFGVRDVEYVFAPASEGVRDSDIVAVSQDLVYQEQNVNETRVRAWLSQFVTDQHQLLAFKLLRRLVDSGYFNAARIHSTFKTLHSIVVARLVEGENWAQEVSRSRKVQNVFVTHCGREGKSGSALLYPYRTANSIHASLAGSISDAVSYLERLAKPGVVVFVDDLIGSGGTSLDGIEKLRSECSKKDINPEAATIFFVALAGTREGIGRLKGSDLDISSVLVQRDLRAEDRAFFPGAEIFPTDEERREAEQMCRAIGNKLEPKQPLGFDDAQALILFSHRCPNNTLPIFHKSGRRYEGREWIPLFRR